ncbi:WXG100 family type VII secretion target [Nocardioides nematodiphilus]|uniref:WXG100 family type VII secretion target n=1 Tax=Nocardioides nematodiphilus TaxID=2849669 RepID=UPI001CD93BB7|nr:WXG100 family type VII secretion target [Nocardioides nematodiphilus]MCA1982609.1 WXG100 family type VII secretion target [Nocardioides nematodiphilus]
MTAYDVDLAELDAAIGRLDASRAALADRIAELESAVTQGRRHWQGEAEAAHEAAHQRLMSGAAELQSALAGLRAVAKHAHAAYAAAAEANSATWDVLG